MLGFRKREVFPDQRRTASFAPACVCICENYFCGKFSRAGLAKADSMVLAVAVVWMKLGEDLLGFDFQ
jgi:hypothetical protein